ncbi:MAG: modification methylase [Bacteroidetes bacterium 4572_77]|nr:MAG: modification methylase [Bacteroidetes bacterium 4572_77]
MNYIGSKHKLSGFIKDTVYSVVGKDLSDKVFCDIFAGTGIVGRIFKQETRQIIANDMEFYSYILNRNYIGNHQEISNAEALLEELNQLDGQQDFVFENYSMGGKMGRQYFSVENAKKIDAIRQKIELWNLQGRISEDAYYFLLCSLLENADKVANTASVYGAYLKQLKKSAQKPMILTPAAFSNTKQAHQVFQKDSNELIKEISGDILYLDPPYNARQYGANYHILNTIAKYDQFTPKGKTGLREYNKSKYCSKRSVSTEFEDLLKNAQFSYIFLSYNNEGLMSVEEVKQLMQKYGRYSLEYTDYQRFKADKDSNRQHAANKTQEYLHVLEKK